ncbi:MAG: LPP20 family lipoprotein [Deltaproteobacteria bacterium]|nr:LPP20 family lipoprotein [Deltaproteobacteria bacterium]
MRTMRRFQMNMAASVTLLVVLGIPDARADGMSGVRQRAKCAQVEMALALGHKVALEDKRACEKVPDALEAKKQPKEPKLEEAKPPAPVKVIAHADRPAWVDRPPVARGILYGVGDGPDAQRAFGRALVMIAAQLQTEIRSTTTAHASETSDTLSVGNRTAHREASHEHVSSTSRMIVGGSIDDAKLEDQWVDHAKGVTWVLASLDVGAIEQRKQALVDAVHAALAAAADRLNQGVRENGVLDQAALRDLITVIGDVRALGDTDLSREVRKSWRPAFQDFRDTVRKLVNCVEVDGDYRLPNGRLVPVDRTPDLRKGSKMLLQVTCRGIPVANARLKTHADGGLVQVPPTVFSEGQGEMEVPVGTSFGTGVRVGFAHDLESVPGAFWLSALKPSRKGQVEFGASRPSTILFEVSGGTSKENRFIAEEMADVALKQWGATTVERRALLKGKVRIRFGTITRPGSKVMQPVELHVALTLASQGGNLLDQTLKTGALAADEKTARADALRSVVLRLNRLKIPGVLDTSVKVR